MLLEKKSSSKRPASFLNSGIFMSWCQWIHYRPAEVSIQKKGGKSQQCLIVTASWSPDDISTALLSRRMRAELEPD